MSPIRKLLIVSVGVLALYGVQACTSETELNPQPLPPGGGGDLRNPQDEAETDKNGSTGAGGMSPAPSTGSDAGAEGGDAADAGDR